MDIHEFANLFQNVKSTGRDSYSAQCPCHDDKTNSLSISAGNDGRILLHCHAECKTEDIVSAVGLSMRDLFLNREKESRGLKGLLDWYAQKSKLTFVRTYDYNYPPFNDGQIKARFEDKNGKKTFCWLKWDSTRPSGWAFKSGAKRLYVVGDALEKAESVVLCEGEKDAETLHRLGFPCVTSAPDGAGKGKGKWLSDYTKQLAGKSIVIFMDHDKIGKDFAETEAKTLAQYCPSVKIIDLSKVWPEIPTHGDVSDYTESHPNENPESTKSALDSLIETTAEYESEPQMQNPDSCNDNMTNFSGQPLQLRCGDFTADGRITNSNGAVVSSTPFVFRERLRNIETGREKWILSHAGYGRWEDLSPIPASDLGSPQKVVALKDFGITIDANRARDAVSYLTTLDELNRDVIPVTESVGHCGWLTDGRFFPYAEGVTFDGNPEFSPMVNAIKENDSGVYNYETWLKHARNARNYSMTVRLILDASFASPLISILNALPFIVHLWGESSNGKTTALELCASVWGNLEELVQDCKTTQTSLELRCGVLKHLPLVADETQLLKGNRGNEGLGVYELTQGRGKERATQSLGIRPTETWKLTILTSGENPLVGDNSAAGEFNRVLQVHCEEDVDLFENPGELKEVIRNVYGYAGKKFIEYLSDEEHRGTVRKLFKTCQESVRQTVDTTGKQVLMLSVILLADILVTDIFFKGDKALEAADLKAYAVGRESVSDGLRGYDLIMEFIARNGSHFKGDAVLEDYGEFDGDTVYIVKSVFNKALKDAGFDPAKVLSWMAHRGKIERGNDRLTVKKRIRGTSVWCVAVLNADGTGED